MPQPTRLSLHIYMNGKWILRGRFEYCEGTGMTDPIFDLSSSAAYAHSVAYGMPVRVIDDDTGIVLWPVEDDGLGDVEPYDADRRDKERRGEL